MKKIPLTQNQFAIVDNHWFDYLNQWKWRALWNKCTRSFYAVRKENNKTILMHRVVSNTPEGMYCDHIHHNTLDCRESELRNVTPSQSVMNRKVQSNNALGIAGVRKIPNKERYVASLYFMGKRVLNKSCSTLEDAIKERKKAKEEYHGEFSYNE